MENAGIKSELSKEKFRTYTLSEEFVEKQFEKYKERHSDEDERTQRENYQKTLDGIFQNKSKRVGAKVFCVGCGAQKRTLRKWYNSYLCSDCWKIKERIGEEQFLKALNGEE